MSGYRCGRKAQSIKPLFRKQQQGQHVRKSHKPVADVRRRPRGADGDKRAEKDKKDVNGAVNHEKKPEKAAFSRPNRPNETFDVARETHQKFIWHNTKENDNEAKQSIVCNCNRCNACGSFRRLR